MAIKSLIAALGLLAVFPAFAQVTTGPNALAADGRSTPAAHAAPPKAAAPGGDGGRVWPNASSKVYHCEGGKYNGKTKKAST